MINIAKIAKSLIELIGHTPLIELSGLEKELGLKARLIAKVEYFNPLGSVKDRAALGMITDAKEKGILKKGGAIIEPTSGNTGVGLAFISAIMGYRLKLTMPESMSIERRKLLKALGAEIVLTPSEKGMSGAIEKAKELLSEDETAFFPNQFENIANREMHRQTTAKEIIEDMDGNIDFFVAGVGTGGTLMGVGDGFRENGIKAKIIAVEPLHSAVLSGEDAGSHGLQGIGANFVPGLVDLDAIDEIVKVSNEDAFDMARQSAAKEGMLVGISSGAALWAAVQIALRKENEGKNIVVLLPDTGERYLSTSLFQE